MSTDNIKEEHLSKLRFGNKPTDVRICGAELYFLPIETRVPLKFGSETLTSVTCARVRIVVENQEGILASGWGETPLSVQWVWPADVSYSFRHEALKDFCEQLTANWSSFSFPGHAIEIGYEFQQRMLSNLLAAFNENCKPEERMPLLAALVCCSAFDIALHDAYGKANAVSTYETYNQDYMNHDLSYYLESTDDSNVDFCGKYPEDFLDTSPKNLIEVWHLIGGLDPLNASQTNGLHVDDVEPILLEDWIHRDGLNCLKIKLRGNDPDWDYQRIVEVGRIAEGNGPYFLSTDFNCTVTDANYVNKILDELERQEPSIYDSILYVEQPFPYELEKYQIDTHSVSSRKPLLMDESAHTWEYVRLGRILGWNGVALKTCKTQTGALLMLCWAKAHGMHVMVQDLTNPMLAQIPHVLLAAYAGTMKGVESNAMQFYPQASEPEAEVHPGLYRRHNGHLNLSTIQGPGFGYRVEEIKRDLGKAAVKYGMA